MSLLTLTSEEIATLLMLNVAVTDVTSGNITPDTLEELKDLQAELEHILFKNSSPLI